MNIIDGKAVSKQLKEKLKATIQSVKEKYSDFTVTLAVVLVGDNPASQVYVRNKIKACEEVGIRSLSYTFPKDCTQEQLEELINSLAEDKKIDGILVQLPLPSHLDEERALKLIPPSKDVDGFCSENIGKLALNSEEEYSCSCTPYGVMMLLESIKYDLKGKNAVVIGRSNIVGKPMAMLLLNADATVTVCHSKTQNLKKICAEADLLVAAIGRPKFVTADMVKEGACVIDVGINRVDGKLCGDVDFENVKEKCSYITPVPGGVGPMTITMLMYNTYAAALHKLDK